jgi:O-antigen/teichoic acid export membrane protein
MLGTIGSGVISILVLRILTSRLGTHGYGQYIILVSLVTGATLIVDLGLNGITYRDLARNPESSGHIIGTNLGLRCGLCIAAVPLVILLVFELYPSQRSALMVVGIIFSFDIVLTVIQTTALSYYGSKVRGEVTAAITLAGRVLFLAAVYIASIVDKGLGGVVVSFISADAITATISIILVYRAARLIIRFEPRLWWMTLKRAAPLGAMQLSNTLYLYVDSIMLSVLSTDRAVAFYGLGFNVITIVGSFSNMFASSLVPGLAVSDSETVRRIVERALYVILCVSIPLGIGGLVLSRNIVSLLGGAKFQGANVPFMLLSISLIATFPGTVLTYAAVSVDRYRRLVGVTVTVLLSNVILNAILIPIASANGAAISLLVCESVSTFAIYLVFGRYLSHYPSLRRAWRPVVAGVIMLVAGLAVNRDIHIPNFSELIAKGVIIILAYCIVLILTRGVPGELFVLIGRSGQNAPPSRRAADLDPPSYPLDDLGAS